MFVCFGLLALLVLVFFCVVRCVDSLQMLTLNLGPVGVILRLSRIVLKPVNLSDGYHEARSFDHAYQYRDHSGGFTCG